MCCLTVLLLPGNSPAQLTINGVAIHGGEYTVELNPAVASGALFSTYVERTARDGFDQVLFRDAEGRVWLHYGRRIILYTGSADRVHSASFKGAPVTVLHIDNENVEIDMRDPLGRRLVALLVGIVLVGLFLGIFSGLIARRAFRVIQKNPLWDHVLYGLVVGMIVAALTYGLLDRRFDPDKLTFTYSHEHLKPFLLVDSP